MEKNNKKALSKGTLDNEKSLSNSLSNFFIRQSNFYSENTGHFCVTV